MGGSTNSRWRLAALAAIGLALLAWFPPFRIVRVEPGAARPAAGRPAAGLPGEKEKFEAAVFAADFWQGELRAAIERAPELASVAPLVRSDPPAARRRHGRASGLGATYYLVRGHGTVVAADARAVTVQLDGTAGERVVLRTGPIFGNQVRDGAGVLNINAFPGLAEFNALAAELNALVEKEVLPRLRATATVGARLRFAGCAEASEEPPAEGAPAMTLVPLWAEVAP